MKKVLITGITGNVGREIAHSLKGKYSILGTTRNTVFESPFKTITCDLSNESQVNQLLNDHSDIEYIIHCAALAHNKGNDLSEKAFTKNNFIPTKNLTNAANSLKHFKSFIYISSISVYGEQMNKTIYLETDECFPESPYAKTKFESEQYLNQNAKFHYTALRLAPVYSETFLLNIDRRIRIRDVNYIVGNGKAKLSMCSMKTILKVINHELEKKKVTNEIYNVADKVPLTYRFLKQTYGTKKVTIVIPKIIVTLMNKINKRTIQNQFVHENTLKLIEDKIYPADKIFKEMDQVF